MKIHYINPEDDKKTTCGLEIYNKDGSENDQAPSSQHLDVVDCGRCKNILVKKGVLAPTGDDKAKDDPMNPDNVDLVRLKGFVPDSGLKCSTCIYFSRGNNATIGSCVESPPSVKINAGAGKPMSYPVVAPVTKICGKYKPNVIKS